MEVEIRMEPIEKFDKQIDEMIATYEEFPKDRRRTEVVLKKLKAGCRPLPLWVEAEDAANFVMEGRHRMAAFKQLGMRSVPIARIRRVDKGGRI